MSELNNFLAVMANAKIEGRGLFKKGYEKGPFFIPRIYCKDGFNISIQIHESNYAGSENGIRTYGMDWKLVEWGFPSQEIDAKKYKAFDPDHTMDTVGGYVPIKLMEELIAEHGGLDYAAIFATAYEQDKKVFLT